MRSEAGANTARKLARLHARGILSTEEVVVRLVLESAYEAPASLAIGLPDTLIMALRVYCSRPPASPSEAPHIGGICGGINVDPEGWRSEDSQAWFDGVYRWQRYFYA